jgi:hypothetical protein
MRCALPCDRSPSRSRTAFGERDVRGREHDTSTPLRDSLHCGTRRLEFATSVRCQCPRPSRRRPAQAPWDRAQDVSWPPHRLAAALTFRSALHIIAGVWYRHNRENPALLAVIGYGARNLGYPSCVGGIVRASHHARWPSRVGFERLRRARPFRHVRHGIVPGPHSACVTSPRMKLRARAEARCVDLGVAASRLALAHIGTDDASAR